ncbi:MAG: LamG-like jellyroll fold domain-containing protein, partial [Patescibacteria group bacterium]
VSSCGDGSCNGTETCSTCPGDCGVCGNSLAGNSFFGMQIENLTLNPAEAVITTTGAKYILKRNEIELWRRIDPKTNMINPRKVGLLKFDSDIGSLSIESADKRTAIIQSEKVTFVFNSDSLFFIKAKSSFNYTHINLIENTSWNKGSGLDRIWTDGYGGSLHANISGNSIVLFQDINSTKIQMSLGDTVSVMVFPAKNFDFERLYGSNSRPFVHFSGENGLTDTNFTELKNNGFGIIVLWDSIYDYGNPGLERTPILLDSGVLGYKIKQSDDLLVRNFVNQAHQNGFKAIVYKYLSAAPEWNYKSGPKQGQHQNIQVTLQWMRGFQQEYRFDGWYFDGADVGSLIEDYNFIRQVRKDIGDNGIIFHHDSVDAWDNDESAWNGQTPLKYTGRKAVMIDNYVDYTVVGETGTIAITHGPDDPYLRYFSSGYGMSQAYASEIRLTKGNAAISVKEKNRVLGQNLNGAERNMNSDWINYFKPYYDKRKTEYLSGNFNPDVDWPPKWFKTPRNIQVKFNSGNSVNIIWDTEENSTGEITYTSDGIWWHNQYVTKGADGMIHQNRELTKQHSVIISNLKNNTFYQFRIRSSNLNISNELIWGYVGNFTTSSEIQKIKCPAQIPENCNDNCKNKLLAYWKFDSGDCDYSENYNLTYYGAGFDGKDSFEFNYDYKDYIEIQKENNPLSDISVYGGENGKSTVIAWVKIRNTGKYNVLAQHIGGFDYFSIGTTGGKSVLKTMVYDKANGVNYWSTSKTSIKENEWTHVAFIFEGGIGYKFYINGILDSEIKNSSLSLHDYSTATGLAYLGYGFDAMSYFDGNVKGLAVFNDALTDSEIYSLAN